jgi:hypothetical protein
MKATIDIPDEIYRKVKAKSAEEGRKIREVTIGLFRQWIDGEIVTPEKEDRASGPVPAVSVEDLRRFPDIESVREAFPCGYRLSGPLVPASSGVPALSASTVDEALAEMDEEELNAHARPR